MNEQAKVGYGWDDAVPVDESGGFVLLPEGEASFEVLKMERARRDVGSFGTVNVADLQLLVRSEVNMLEARMLTSLILHPDMAWKLTQFFTSIGQRKHGETGQFKPDWKAVPGSTGSCRLSVREFEFNQGKRKGQKGKANQVDAYLCEDAKDNPEF